jgi:hypothetical protein
MTASCARTRIQRRRTAKSLSKSTASACLAMDSRYSGAQTVICIYKSFSLHHSACALWHYDARRGIIDSARFALFAPTSSDNGVEQPRVVYIFNPYNMSRSNFLARCQYPDATADPAFLQTAMSPRPNNIHQRNQSIQNDFRLSVPIQCKVVVALARAVRILEVRV